MSQALTPTRTLVPSRAVVSGGLIAAACALLVACGGGGAKASAPAARPSITVVALITSAHGTILTDAKGSVLYTYTADDPGGKGCTGACLALRPPLLLPAGVTQPTAGPGIGQLGSIARADGVQVTYRGQPLYTYVDDAQPGQITGEDVEDGGGTWLLATVAAPGALSTSTSTSAGAPATQPSATPAARPPVTQPPATHAPVTPAPTTRAPTTDAPATAPPATPPATTAPPTTARTTPPTTAPTSGPSY